MRCITIFPKNGSTAEEIVKLMKIKAELEKAVNKCETPEEFMRTVSSYSHNYKFDWSMVFTESDNSEPDKILEERRWQQAEVAARCGIAFAQGKIVIVDRKKYQLENMLDYISFADQAEGTLRLLAETNEALYFCLDVSN